MLEKPNRKKADKQDDTLPTNIEQLIEKYDLNKVWTYTDELITASNTMENQLKDLDTNKLDKTGGTISGDLSINKNIEVDGALDVGGKTTLKDTTINGNEEVTGHMAIGKKYDTSKGGALQVGGISRIDGDNYIDGANVVAGRSYLGQKVRNSQGTYVENFNAGHGTSGYIKICTLTIGGTYQNQPIIFGVIQRTRYGRIILQFVSSADTKPSGFNIFQSSGNINPYIVKTGDSTWDLYIEKSEAYDQIEITELYKGEYQNAITITWKNEIATSLPSGAVNAGWESYSMNVRYATSAGNLSDPNGYVYSGTREEGFESEWLRTHSFTGSINNNGWRSLINVRHRGGGGDGQYWGMQIMDDNMTSNTWNLLVRKQNNGVWYNWETIPRRVNLYNNTSGATGTITLSQSAANFTYLRIYARTSSENFRISVDVYSPNDQSAYLIGGWQSGTNVNYKSAAVKISGTSITRVSNGFFAIGDGGDATVSSPSDVVAILRVDGYK